eukprot:NODE_6798_length_535_cov_15.576132_g6372_i0.p1 GENE.NODE_6798_length_535_cov_15.576132_g6372_i0~~NODE_6798_length_535_cov_15.576132_g6372_i0.p1  ORF type:complete len:119 (+),score=37.50 NODE_6798_length_535_cov_15.576132_g6372_i0:129-485(+)
MDYLERACREEEVPLLQKAWSQKAEHKKASQLLRQAEIKREMREAWEHAVAEKQRLARMSKHWEAFKVEVLSSKKAGFDGEAEAPEVSRETAEAAEEADFEPVVSKPEPKKFMARGKQ